MCSVITLTGSYTAGVADCIAVGEGRALSGVGLFVCLSVL